MPTKGLPGRSKIPPAISGSSPHPFDLCSTRGLIGCNCESQTALRSSFTDSFAFFSLFLFSIEKIIYFASGGDAISMVSSREWRGTNLVKNRVGCYYILGVILGFLGFFEIERSVWTMIILSF